MVNNTIICATCSLKEDTLDNDIILCDGACKRGFHQNCLNPPLLTKDSNIYFPISYAIQVPEGEEKWHCPACDCKIDCIESINKFQGTSDLSISDSWQKVFPEAAAMAHGPMQSDVPDLPSDDSEDNDFDPNISEEHVACDVEGSSEEDGDEGSYSDDSNFITSSDNLEHVKDGEKVDDLGLPSDDSEDDDYDPAGPDSDEDIKEKQDESDFTSDSDDFCADIAKSCHMEEVSSGRKAGDHTNDLEGAPVGPNTSMSHLTTKDLEIDQDAILPSRRRQVKPLDYKKLYDDAYGEAPSDSSDGEDWSGKSTLKEDSEEENEVDSFVHKSSRGTRAVHRGLVNDQHSRRLTSGPEVDHAADGKAPPGSSYREDLSQKCTPETEFTPQSPQQSLNYSVNWQNTEELLTPNGSSTTGQKRHYGPIINQAKQFKIHQYPSRVVKESLAQELGLTFHQVIPTWCYGKDEGWSSLVDRWLEEKLKKPLSGMKLSRLALAQSNRKDVESEYYGNTEENLESYKESFQRPHPGPDAGDPVLS
ncbi:homeobox protein HOX1A-like [Triticum aestivum]|uniref:homeobox protein HOX1A-like n=1 Tax=Triticum aestivum TaxID=4565 RepID=UPI001D0205C6|nr:homeobox protein HOX1A-like [Triticum aestivum]